jgi:hypothetical protein
MKRALVFSVVFAACGSDPQLPPTGQAALKDWLAQGLYTAWACEPAAHDSRNGSPHGMTRICNNAKVAGNGAAEYPQGAASVKELVDAEGTVHGHSVMKKLADGSIGANWYFFEISNGRVYADGADSSGCASCHSRAGSGGLPGKDFVFTQVD